MFMGSVIILLNKIEETKLLMFNMKIVSSSSLYFVSVPLTLDVHIKIRNDESNQK